MTLRFRRRRLVRKGLSDVQVRRNLRPTGRTLVMAARDALPPLTTSSAREVVAADMERSYQRATDFLMALHVLDEVGREDSFQAATGDGRR